MTIRTEDPAAFTAPRIIVSSFSKSMSGPSLIPQAIVVPTGSTSGTLPEEDYDMAGGFVFGTLGRIPEVGDEVACPRGTLRVVAMEGRRVTRLAFVRGDTGAKSARGEPSEDGG